MLKNYDDDSIIKDYGSNFVIIIKSFKSGKFSENKSNVHQM